MGRKLDKKPENNAAEAEKPTEVKIDWSIYQRKATKNQNDVIISQERLQEAIIWSEILGKPVSRRRKRREAWR